MIPNVIMGCPRDYWYLSQSRIDLANTCAAVIHLQRPAESLLEQTSSTVRILAGMGTRPFEVIAARSDAHVNLRYPGVNVLVAGLRGSGVRYYLAFGKLHAQPLMPCREPEGRHSVAGHHIS